LHQSLANDECARAAEAEVSVTAAEL
jgi:hypothetical protein